MQSPIDILRREIQNLLQCGNHKVLGVCGLGGAGKSTLCREINLELIKSCCIFEIDWYLTHSSADRRQLVMKSLENKASKDFIFWQDPTNWYDWDTLIKDLTELKDTGFLKRDKLWSQGTGEKTLSITLKMKHPSVILCDGIYLLHSPIRELIDRVVMVEASSDEALSRSTSRDAHRNPEPYKKFKASVAENFDNAYFTNNFSKVDVIARLG